MPGKHWNRVRGLGLVVVCLLAIYLAAAYVVVPLLWKGYARRHPAFEDLPGVTYTADGIPADPINVGLVGSKTDVMRIMLAAKWYPADPLTLRSCLKIAEASVLKRSYDDAPVSNEFLFKRKEDLAFEQPVGADPRHRHHVRFWQTEKRDEDGRPIWLGSAVFDRRVGLSRTTGQITHLTAANVDAERDKLFDDLKHTGQLASVVIIHSFHKVLEGRNGEGIPWRTDGDLYEGFIKMVISPSSSGNRPSAKD